MTLAHAEWMEKMQSLPPEKQSEVFNLIEYLLKQYGKKNGEATGCDKRTRMQETTEVYTGPLAALRARVPDQQGKARPMNRDEIYDRPILR